MSSVHCTFEADAATAQKYPEGHQIARSALPHWGLLVEEDGAYERPLSEQVAVEIGPGEAVEYTEIWELIVAVAQAAYEAGRAS